ncbi:MAG: Serine/threonine-protein kinase PrkC, partial [Planctomycetota bacterium]
MPDENLPEKPDKNPGLAKTLDYLNQNPGLAKTLDHPLENEHQPEKPATTAKSPASFQADGVKNTNAIELQGNFEVLLGRFCVQKTLGEGTFGKVYLAKDQQLNRLVAIKISKTKFHDKTLVDSFLNEARMLARLDHPNIVPVHDVGNSESEGFFIVSKYLEGGSLSQAMNRQFADVFWICNTIALIADGLHHAHVRKLVHRDIKPDNILLDNSGNPCIV